jgi:predicted O-methyltransferase YrrM
MPPIHRNSPPELVVPSSAPEFDPAPVFELFRGSFATELLVSAVAHLRFFDLLAEGPRSWNDLRKSLQLAERPMHVVVTALRAMGMLSKAPDGALQLTSIARHHLLPESPYYVGDYFSLAAHSPGVAEMTDRLRSNKPKGSKPDEQGVGFIFRDGVKSAMEEASGARAFTLALAGRAKNVAPTLAEALPLAEARLLVDVAGGTGIYSIALLRKNPSLRAIVWDRPEVLRVAAEFAEESGVGDRLKLMSGDMFVDALPRDADVILLSNVLHDWDLPECRKLLKRCSEAMATGARLVIHDVFLNDELDGPLPIALYSAALFSVTEGRAYSVAEYSSLLNEVGIRPVQVTPTLIHCGALGAVKSSDRRDREGGGNDLPQSSISALGE